MTTGGSRRRRLWHRFALRQRGGVRQHLQWIKASVGNAVRLIPIFLVVTVAVWAIRVPQILLDDHEVVRRGLKDLLEIMMPMSKEIFDKAQMDLVLGRIGQIVPTPEQHSTQLIVGDVANKRWSKIRPDAPAAAIAQRLQLLTMPVAGR